jgi:hypothetical protein
MRVALADLAETCGHRVFSAGRRPRFGCRSRRRSALRGNGWDGDVMSKSGHYSGGSTLIGPRNKSWFGQKTPKWTEKNANDIRTEEKLRKRKQEAAKKKAAPAKPVRKFPGMKPETSVVDRTVTEVSQGRVCRKGGRDAIAVEYGTVRGRAKR